MRSIAHRSAVAIDRRGSGASFSMMIRLDRGCPGVGSPKVSDPWRGMPPGPPFGEDDTGRVEVGEHRPEPERLAGAVLDSLASHIAVLDESGTILAVNQSWRQFARANGADDRAVSAGVNYLRICDETRGEGAGVAAAFATGIRDVLAGRRATIELEYPCHAPDRRHWFVGRVSRLRWGGPPRVVVSHEEVTGRKRAEDQVRRLNEQLNRRLRRTKALRRIDAAITNSRDPGRALALVVEEAIGQLGVDAADILICGEAAGAMEFAIGLGLPPGALGHGATDPGGLAGRVVRVGLPLFVPDLAQAPVDGPRRRRLVAEGFVTYHAIPLMAEGRVKGVLECFRRAAMEPDSEWLAFAAMLAGQAAIAIDNAALFEDLRRSNEELKVAYDSTIEGWARALDLRDHDTEGHSRRVTEMALALRETWGWPRRSWSISAEGPCCTTWGSWGSPMPSCTNPARSPRRSGS